jgi:hypothetical protein
MGFYLSSDAVISTADRFTGWTRTAQNGLAAGALFACAGEIGIPTGIAPGTYYLGAYVDDQFAVAESNANNNYRVSDNGPITSSDEPPAAFLSSPLGFASVARPESSLCLTWGSEPNAKPPTGW